MKFKWCLPPVGSTTVSEAKDQAAEAALNRNSRHPKGISRHVWLSMGVLVFATFAVLLCGCDFPLRLDRKLVHSCFRIEDPDLARFSLTLEPTRTLCSSASQWALHSAVSLQMVPASDQCTETNAVSWMQNRPETPLNEKPVICHSQSHPLVKTNQELHLYENCVPFIARCLFWTKCVFLR